MTGTTLTTEESAIVFGTVTDATVGVTFADGNAYSLTGTNVTVGQGTAPTDTTDDNRTTVDAYLHTEATGTNGSLTTTLDYANADTGVINESTLAMYRLNASTWERFGVTSVDTEARTVSGTTMGSGLLAPRGRSTIMHYTNDDGIVDTNGLRAAIDDWRAGDIDTELLREVIDHWRSGEKVE